MWSYIINDSMILSRGDETKKIDLSRKRDREMMMIKNLEVRENNGGFRNVLLIYFSCEKTK